MGDLYKRLAALCDERGISGYRMCKDVGIQPSIMTDLKMGRRSSVKAETADRIANYFGVSVGYLLGKEKEPATDSDGFRLEDDIDLTDVDIAFLGGFKELTEENQATIRDMVRIMRERQKE